MVNETAMQKVEHYRIAAWGTARALAKATGHKITERAMEQELKDGKKLDEKLSDLAEKEITPALLSEDVDEESGEVSDGEEEGQATRKRGGSGSHRHAPRH